MYPHNTVQQSLTVDRPTACTGDCDIYKALILDICFWSSIFLM